jgi:hypothetical protein
MYAPSRAGDGIGLPRSSRKRITCPSHISLGHIALQKDPIDRPDLQRHVVTEWLAMVATGDLLRSKGR